MQISDEDDSLKGKRICSECVREEFLSAEIESTGASAECTYCKHSGRIWFIEEMAHRIETAFKHHYIRTAHGPDSTQDRLQADEDSIYVWEREGIPVLEAIESAAEIPAAAASDVLELLSAKHFSFDSAVMREECEFNPESYYELKDSSDMALQIRWASFEESLKKEARFFSRSAANYLAAIFGRLDRLKTTDGHPLVMDAGPGLPINHLYRAREFQSEDELLDALRRPDVGLAPPPASRATAGRMNARGIVVFYGAQEPNTAIAEVRPSVGSRVAVAKFSIIRPLRLLDLTALPTAHDPGSIFDPSLKHRLERVAFLKTLGLKISRPIMPNDQDFDYLATQAIADFLAYENEPQLDGIIFTSAQWKGGSNIVLFRKAAKVESLECPKDTEIAVYTGFHEEDGWKTDYSVTEYVPPEPDPAATKPAGLYNPLYSFHFPLVDSDSRGSTLRVNPESVVVHHVEQIQVVTTPFSVDRSRSVKREPKF